MNAPTAKQRAVLDALGDAHRNITTLAFDMGISEGAVASRLVGLWNKGLVDRQTTGFGYMQWHQTYEGIER